MFQSSFELTGYITSLVGSSITLAIGMFQSSFELTGYITLFGEDDIFPNLSFKALSSLQVI